MTSLFRPEAVQAQEAQFLGSIRIARNPSFTLVSFVAVGLSAALVSFAVWGEVTRKTRVPGFLTPVAGTTQIAAPAAGVILERRVAEGDRVEAGQVLFVIGTDRQGADGPTAQLLSKGLERRRLTIEAGRVAREAQIRQRASALDARVRALDIERNQASAEADMADRRVQLAHRSVQRLGDLVRDGFVSDVQLQGKQEELLEIQTRAQTARRTVAALAREQQSATDERLSVLSEVQALQAQTARELSLLDQEVTENDSRKTVVVVAPERGAISALHLTPGTMTNAGQSLATMVMVEAGSDTPWTNTLQAQLFAPSRALGFIKPGQAVSIRYSALNYQKYGLVRGVTRAVSRTPIQIRDLPPAYAELLVGSIRSNEPLYRIDVTLLQQSLQVEGLLAPLVAGAIVDADLIQDRRQVFEWVISPLRAIKM